MNYTNEIRAFIVTNFLYGDASAFSDHTSFLGGGILDSTGILELVTFLESTYHISIATEELLPANLDSVNNVAQFLSRKIKTLHATSASPPSPERLANPSYLYAPQPEAEGPAP